MACNFLSGKVARLNPDVIALLDAFKDYVSLSALCDEFGFSALLLRKLLAYDILVREGSALASKEEALFSEWDWNLAAKQFHFATNAVHFEPNNETVWRALDRKMRSAPPPSPFREFPGEYVRLPPPEVVAINLDKALAERRTCRNFVRAPMELEQLATILGITWGVTRTSKANQSLGDFVLKTSPSGGARHPTEVFACVSRVNGLAPGIYHYSPKLHALCRTVSGDPSRVACTLCSEQRWVADAAVAFFMTAIVSRTMWKYGHSHAYRVLLLDAGHLGQTFHLVCTSLGLGPFTTAAVNGANAEKALGIDGINEIVVYAAAAGLRGD